MKMIAIKISDLITLTAQNMMDGGKKYLLQILIPSRSVGAVIEKACLFIEEIRSKV